ncbi:MAG: guanylate kinase [Thermodesulfobacteria bacterium]|nr:guanylate kinase [Thermodesulfobacteriota bacterium]
MDRGDLFIISAPSGAGKSTLCSMLVKELDNIVFSVSHTTRPPRPGEVDGKDYFFVSEAEFQRLVAEDAFLEWARVHGNFYGTHRGQVMDKLAKGLDVILDIDTQGAKQVKEKLPGAVTIFILPPSWQELKRRLVARGSEDREKIKLRLKNALLEMEEVPNYHYTIVNDQLQVAFEELKSIIIAERNKTRRVIGGKIDLAALKPDPEEWDSI